MWPRRLVAALPPEAIGPALDALLAAGVAPADVTVLAPGTLCGDLPRGLRVRRGMRVLARREATAAGGAAGALIGAVLVLTLGTALAHLPDGPAHLLPAGLTLRDLGAELVSFIWLYGALIGLLLGAVLGMRWGMPAVLAARCDDSLSSGHVLVAARPRRGDGARARAALEGVGARNIRLCYGDLRAVGRTLPNPAAPEDDPRHWMGS